ncbi:DUF4249 family protein [Rhodothermus bifroesti]|uniref:DUF4249 family protein n=1 Tax=Rhodothermus marinus TaxID=29549 RepID=A0A7V2F5R6_RHOMR|nr:DUF4249 family protein [Rhodothermus bifroesti]GBD01473.1 hypothetical protein HRbin18_01197 [bacterium HR18]
MRRWLVFGLLGCWLLGCDTLMPGSEPVLVVEAFFQTGAPPPAIRLRQTGPLYSASVPAVTDAQVTLQVDTLHIPYQPDAAVPGVYQPLGALTPLQAGQVVRLQVFWQGIQVQAIDTLPPPIRIDSVQVMVPESPVQAVLLDSLLLNDSLATGARFGYLYPVTVTLWWQAPIETQRLYWVRPHLRPEVSFSSTIVDLFLRTEQILRESQSDQNSRGQHYWTGVYAIPVEKAHDPLPPHRLRVALVRSGQAYARFASSRKAPERREPVSNVVGGLGIAAALALDSLFLTVRPLP